MSVIFDKTGIVIGGYDLVSLLDVDKYRQDLQDAFNKGFRAVRVGSTDQSYVAAYPVSKKIAEMAMEIFDHVTWGVTNSTLVGANSLSANNWSTYVSRVMTAAADAEALGVHRFEIGNELESTNDNTTLTDEQLVSTYLPALADQVRTVFSGEIAYASTAGVTIRNFWITYGLNGGGAYTGLDILGANCYGGNQYDTPGFELQLKDFITAVGADHLYISEWNLYYNWAQVTMPEDRRADEIGKRRRLLEKYNLENKFFVWTKNNNDFSAQTINNEYRDFLYSLVNERRGFDREIVERDTVERMTPRDCGKSAEFTGNSGIVTAITPAPVFSTMFWIFKKTDGNNDKILDCCDVNSGNGFDLRQGAGGNIKRLTLVIKDGNVTTGLVQSPQLPSGIYYHVAVTYQDNDARLYINSELVGVDNNCIMSSPASLLTLGKSAAQANAFMKMLMDDFVFKNYAIFTPEDIKKHMLDNVIPEGSSIVHNFDDQTDDFSGNENHSIPSNISYNTLTYTSVR
jgi:hypothetical protein